jgi:hypothetical protein
VAPPLSGAGPGIMFPHSHINEKGDPKFGAEVALNPPGSRLMTTEAFTPAADQSRETHSGASNEHFEAAFLRSSPANSSKSGFQKRVDKLVARQHELQRTNGDLAAQLERAMNENQELKIVNFRLQGSLERCVEALRKKRDR